MKVSVNGRLIDKKGIEDIFEPGFLFGWGIFEVLRAYKGSLPFLALHRERLERSLEVLGLEPVEFDWKKAINNLLSENSLEDAYVRITAYKKRKGTGIIIYADKFTYYGPEVYEKGFSSITSSYIRNCEDVCSKVKSLSYLNNRMSWDQAQKNKTDEALVLNSKDFLVGGSRSNLFLVKAGQVLTPSISNGAFEGITRAVVIDIAKGLGVDFREKDINPDELLSCDEAFITSALMEVMPLVKHQNNRIGEGVPGKITLKILDKYRGGLHG